MMFVAFIIFLLLLLFINSREDMTTIPPSDGITTELSKLDTSKFHIRRTAWRLEEAGYTQEDVGKLVEYGLRNPESNLYELLNLFPDVRAKVGLNKIIYPNYESVYLPGFAIH